VRLGALGDTIVLEPALAALRSGVPAVDWELLGTLPYARLLRHQLRRLHDGGAARFAPLFAPPALGTELARFLAGFERAAIFSSNQALRRHLEQHVPIVLAAPPLPPAEYQQGVVDYLLDRLRPWAAAPPRRIPVIPVEPAGSDRSRGEIVLAPGAGSEAKRWPWACWQELLGCLRPLAAAASWTILLGPAESDLSARARRWAGEVSAAVLESPELEALANRLAGARLFIGNDSGPTHLAAALGCPTLALFGPDSQRCWEPRGARVLVVRAAAGWSAVGQVGRAAGRLLGPRR
jgi:hypothetical protein